MNTIELSELLIKTTYSIEVTLNGEIISQGTAFCVDQGGLLITAAHVVTNRTPIIESDYLDPNLKIKASQKFGRDIDYEVLSCGISLDWPEGPLKKALDIDLAILKPSTKISNYPYLKIADRDVPVGTKVLMSGFSEELESPLNISSHLDEEFIKKKQPDQDLDIFYKHIKSSLIMIKSGIVGFMDSYTFQNTSPNSWNLQVGIYYIDNAMHRGSSGGPVITEDGFVVGVITKRSVVVVQRKDIDFNKDIEKYDIPSGSTLAISPRTVTDFVKIKLEIERVKTIKVEYFRVQPKRTTCL